MVDFSWLADGEASSLNERGPYGTVGECVTAARDAGVRGDVEIWRREDFKPHIDLESLANDQIELALPYEPDVVADWADGVITSENYDAVEGELDEALWKVLCAHGLAPTFFCWVFQEIVEVK